MLKWVIQTRIICTFFFHHLHNQYFYHNKAALPPLKIGEEVKNPNCSTPGNPICRRSWACSINNPSILAQMRSPTNAYPLPENQGNQYGFPLLKKRGSLSLIISYVLGKKNPTLEIWAPLSPSPMYSSLVPAMSSGNKCHNLHSYSFSGTNLRCMFPPHWWGSWGIRFFPGDDRDPETIDHPLPPFPQSTPRSKPLSPKSKHQNTNPSNNRPEKEREDCIIRLYLNLKFGQAPLESITPTSSSLPPVESSSTLIFYSLSS